MEFAAAFSGGDVPVYSRIDFVELNRGKADDVHYLLLADNKVRFGIVLGQRGGVLYSPFSAPFGGFVTNSDQSVALVYEAVTLLAGYIRSLGMAAEVALPPVLYHSRMMAKYVSAFLRYGQLMYADINYHYDLTGDEPFEARMNDTARKKYRRARKCGFRFEMLDSAREADIARAYAVIKANRDSKGYPLRMTFEEVVRTAPVVDARFAVLSVDGADVAAVQLHRVTDSVMQVVYWGDAPGYERMHPMNMLAPETFGYCRSLGFSVLDIGPSSSEGVPSEGLCFFKESLGCVSSLKPRFLL